MYYTKTQIGTKQNLVYEMSKFKIMIMNDQKSITNLEKFVSKNGAFHYRLDTNKEKIKLVKSENRINFNKFIHIKNEKIKIFEPDFPIFWNVTS